MTLFLLALLAPVTALAEFEGTLEMQVTHKHGSGLMHLYLSRAGIRSEVRVMSQGAQMDMVFLHLFKNPDVAYRIDDAQKSYVEVDLKAAREARIGADGVYEAAKLGVETIRGYSCVHARLKDQQGSEIEIWTSREIASFREIGKMMGPSAPANEGMQKALKSIGAEGFPVKVLNKTPGNETSMELIKVEKKAPAAALFQIPTGYRKLEQRKISDDHGGHGPGPTQLPPALKKQLEEQLKAMTPEEREAAKRAMQQQGIQLE